MNICSWYIYRWGFPSLCGSSFHHLREEKHLLRSSTLKIPDGYSRLGQLPPSNGPNFCCSSPLCLVPHCSNNQHLKRASLLLQGFYMLCLIKPLQFLQSRLRRILLGVLVYSRSYGGFTTVLCGWGAKLLWCGSGSCALLAIKSLHRMRQKWVNKEE